MPVRNVETYRAGHEAFNRRDFDAMVSAYAGSITWTDQPRALIFRTPKQFQDEFLAGWVQAFSDCNVSDAVYLDAGDTVVARFTATGTNDGPMGHSRRPGGRSESRCARCGTSTRPVTSSVAISTTTRRRCSRSLS